MQIVKVSRSCREANEENRKIAPKESFLMTAKNLLKVTKNAHQNRLDLDKS